MPHIKRYILLSVLALFLCQCNLLQDDSTDDSTSGFLKEGAYLGEYWPTDAWRECAPEEVGMIPERLESVYGYAANPNLNTHAILIVRRSRFIGMTNCLVSAVWDLVLRPGHPHRRTDVAWWVVAYPLLVSATAGRYNSVVAQKEHLKDSQAIYPVASWETTHEGM